MRYTKSHFTSSSFVYCCADPRDLHSFPTRRSSDLGLVPRIVKSFKAKIGGVISSFRIKTLNREINIEFVENFTKNNGHLLFNINDFVSSSITITGQTDIQ